MANAKLPPFFLRVRVCTSLFVTFLLNLAMFQRFQWLGGLLPSTAQKYLFCNPGMNCHACPWAIGACPVGVMTYSSAVHTFPVYVVSFMLVLTAVLGRLTCAFLCPFGLLQDLLYKIPFLKFKLPRFMNYGKYLALGLLVFLFPYWLGFEHSGYLQVDKPKVDKAVAAEGEDEADAATKLDVAITVKNRGSKPVEKPQIDLSYVSTADSKDVLFQTRKEFPGVTIAPGETITLPKVRLDNRLAEATLNVSSPQSEVEQTSPYQLYYCRLCPVGTLEASLPAYATGQSSGMYGRAAGWSILGLFLVLMLMVSRPFCRTFCPAGAIYGLFSRFSLSRMSLDKDACVSCGICDRVCPVDLDVAKEVGGAECVACGDCIKVCPKSGIKRTFGL